MEASTFLSISHISIWVCIAILAFISVRVMNTQINTKNKMERALPFMDYGLKTGSKFPVKSLVSTTGEEIQFDSKYKGHIVIFTSVSCSICKNVYPLIPQFKKKYPDIQVVTITLSEDDQMLQDIITKYNIKTPVVQIDHMDKLEVFSTNRFPFAYLLSNDVVYFKGVVNTEEHFNILVKYLPAFKKAG